MAYAYDDANIFAMILRGDIPNNTVAETELTLAFRDINPQAPVHILLIPKGKYVTADDFAANAKAEEIADFWRVFAGVISAEGLGAEGDGYRVISNAGEHGLQDVPHFHLHLLAGHRLGPLLAR
ncbi:MAG: HIT domain-containing protein [Boseongicola sp.]|nr:MAG: HIT domain-containing protein [Boseongicola sp.]